MISYEPPRLVMLQILLIDQLVARSFLMKALFDETEIEYILHILNKYSDKEEIRKVMRLLTTRIKESWNIENIFKLLIGKK